VRTVGFSTDGHGRAALAASPALTRGAESSVHPRGPPGATRWSSRGGRLGKGGALMARAYTEAKWAGLAPVSRRSVAEALVTVTIALTAKEPGAPGGKVLRQALFAWAFNPATRGTEPPPKIAAALDWAERAFLPVAELEDTATVRLALAACSRTLMGQAAAGATQRRRRLVFYNALGYAVEQGHLASNPIDRIQWTTPAVAQSVDRRVVVSPAQARSLFAAVRGFSDRGAHLEGSTLPVLRRAAPLGGGHAPRK